jgi:hypothetical protein
MAGRRPKLILGAASVIVFFTIAFFAFQQFRPSHVYSSFKSPDGEHTLIVHQYSRFVAVPGDSGSGPGYVELFNKDGTRIARTSVPSVLDFSQEENLQWTAHTLVVPGMLDLSF